MARQFLTTLITLTVLTFCSALTAQESTKLEGLASVMKDSSYVHEYVALHPQIAKGTLIEVKNKKNGRIAVVKVVGKPKSARKSNVLIYISKKAYQKLQSPNPTFAVELNYKTNSESDAYVVDPIRIQQENEASQNPFAQPYQPNFVQNNDPFGAVDQNIQNNNQPIIHIVNASQTSIYSIARLYNIYDARKIAQWNKLGNRVSLTPGQRLTIYTSQSQNLVNITYLSRSFSSQNNVVRESGFADLISNIDNSKPFLALHATAPIGTLLTIKNNKNGKSVVVTVVGKLINPKSGTIVQLTLASFKRLGISSNRFTAQLNYINKPQKQTGNSISNNIKTKAAYLPDDMLADKWWVAFHKTAPIGSYIQVRNPQNSQSATLLVAGGIQGKVTDKQVVVQVGQAGMQALNDGEAIETLPVTVEQIKGIKEGNMERVISDIANVYEEGIGVSMSGTYKKNTQKTNRKLKTPNYSTPIKHFVSTGENIYNIAAKYNIARSELRHWNKLKSNNLTLNQVLSIYLPKKINYLVKAGDTKLSLARQYKIYEKQIDIWNNLRTRDGLTDLKIGQNIVMYIPTGPRPNNLFFYTPVTQNPTFQPKPNQKFICLHKSAPIGTLILVEKVRSPLTNPFGNNSNRTNTGNPFGTNTTTNNDPFGSVTTGNNNNTVVNPFNNATTTNNNSNLNQTQTVNPNTTTKYYRVIVEVVGKLPDTEVNKDIIIKLSDDAFNGLSDGKKSLPLKLSYFEL